MFKLTVDATCQIGGHEGVGEVVKLGPHVSEVQVGDRVGIKFTTSACLVCDACNAGFDNKCGKRSIAGFKTPGTFQQYIITDPRYATPIPKDLESTAAAPLLCGGVTVWAALKEASCKLGDWITISGAGGGLGHLAVQYSKALGFRVVAIDHGSKGDFCKGLGADIFLDFTLFDNAGLASEIKQRTNGGSHAVVVCNSSTAAYDQALDFLRYAGTLVCVGIPETETHPMPKSSPLMIAANRWKIKGESRTGPSSSSSKFLLTQPGIGTVPGNRVEAIECLQPAALGLVKPQLTIEPMNKLSEACVF